MGCGGDTLVALVVGRARTSRVGAASEGAPKESAARGLKAPWGAMVGGSDRAQTGGRVVASPDLIRLGFGVSLWVWCVLSLALSTAQTLGAS